MVICGDDGLAHRLVLEPEAVCGEVVTVVLPSDPAAPGVTRYESRGDAVQAADRHRQVRPHPPLAHQSA